MLTYFITAVLAVSAAGLVGQRADYGASYPIRRSGFDRTFALLAAAILISVAAFRWRVGVDYVSYTVLYDNRYLITDLWQMRPWEEPGFTALAQWGSRLYDDSATMFGLASLITVGLTVSTLYRHSTRFGYAILLYIVTTQWQGSFNGVRQFVACAILFAGHRYILERRFFPYVFVVLAASLFHISALVALLLYWVPQARMGFVRAGALIVAAVAAVTAYELLGEVFAWVKQDDVTEGSYFVEQVNPVRIMLAFAPIAAYVFFTDKSRMRANEFFWVNVTLVNAAILLASSGSAYVARFAIYTSVYLALSLPVIWRTRYPALSGFLALATVVSYCAFWFLETSIEPSLRNFRWIFERGA